LFMLLVVAVLRLSMMLAQVALINIAWAGGGGGGGGYIASVRGSVLNGASFVVGAGAIGTGTRQTDAPSGSASTITLTNSTVYTAGDLVEEMVVQAGQVVTLGIRLVETQTHLQVTRRLILMVVRAVEEPILTEFLLFGALVVVLVGLQVPVLQEHLPMQEMVGHLELMVLCRVVAQVTMKMLDTQMVVMVELECGMNHNGLHRSSLQTRHKQRNYTIF
jgi:hypothetical protein